MCPSRQILIPADVTTHPRTTVCLSVCHLPSCLSVCDFFTFLFYHSVWLPICLLVCVSLCRSACCLIYLRMCLYIFFFICLLPVRLSVSACLSVCSFVRLPVCPSACLSVCLSIRLLISLTWLCSISILNNKHTWNSKSVLGDCRPSLKKINSTKCRQSTCQPVG